MKSLLLTTALVAGIFSATAVQAESYGKKEMKSHEQTKEAYGEKAKDAVATTVEAQDLVTIAASNPDFSTLVAAVQAAGLVEALQGDGPFTIFAPTNEAFAALPEGTVENLLKPENLETLQTILKYHVVGAKVPASAAIGNEVELDTLAGIKLPVDGTGEGVTVGGANVTATDIMGSNGIIHVVDAVILPPSE